METQHSFVNTVTIKENPTYPIINKNQFHVINKKLFSAYFFLTMKAFILFVRYTCSKSCSIDKNIEQSSTK